MGYKEYILESSDFEMPTKEEAKNLGKILSKKLGFSVNINVMPGTSKDFYRMRKPKRENFIPMNDSVHKNPEMLKIKKQLNDLNAVVTIMLRDEFQFKIKK